MIDHLLIGMVIVGALLGLPWHFRELREARMADPLDPIGIAENRKEQLERSIETPAERLDRMRREQKRLFQPNKFMFRLRLLQVLLIIGGLVGLYVRHV